MRVAKGGVDKDFCDNLLTIPLWPVKVRQVENSAEVERSYPEGVIESWASLFLPAYLQLEEQDPNGTVREFNAFPVVRGYYSLESNSHF